MKLPFLKNRKKEEAYYDEDNVVRVKEFKGIRSKGINVKAGLRIINFIGAIFSLFVFGLLVYGVYYVTTNFIDLSPLVSENPVTTITVETGTENANNLTETT